MYVFQILHNLNNNLNEYGEATPPLRIEDRQESIRLWSTREARAMHSIINSALLLKVNVYVYHLISKSQHLLYKIIFLEF